MGRLLAAMTWLSLAVLVVSSPTFAQNGALEIPLQPDRWVIRSLMITKTSGALIRDVNRLEAIGQRGLAVEDVRGVRITIPLAELDRVDFLRDRNRTGMAAQVGWWDEVQAVSDPPVVLRVHLDDLRVAGDALVLAKHEKVAPQPRENAGAPPGATGGPISPNVEVVARSRHTEAIRMTWDQQKRVFDLEVETVHYALIRHYTSGSSGSLGGKPIQ